MINLPFFTTQEIHHFETIAGTKYRKANPQNVADAEQLKPLVHKLNEWIKHSLVDDFKPLHDYTWQWSGTFKSYLWIRVYKEAPINAPQPKVYYVFGLNEAGELYMELNCQRSNYSNGSNQPLSKSKRDSFDAYLHQSEYVERRISSVEINHFNWTRLIEETKQFLRNNEVIYDELLNVVDPQISNNLEILTLIPEDKPESIVSRIPSTPSFKGRDVDYVKQMKESNFLGCSGEQLVLQSERRKLKELGFSNEEIEKVKKMADGEGYDIRSFDENKNPLFIEVKTTTGSKHTPFYISHNELQFAERNSKNYFIFRVFEFNPHPQPRGKMFIWSLEDVRKATKKPLHYEISTDK